MKIAILTLTKGGLAKGLEVQKKLNVPVDVYGQAKFGGEGYRAYDTKVIKVFESLFETHDVVLAIMATGIVIRSIKDLIGHKSKDPAILVMDEAGKHVISLLSGHLGGGNYWTTYIARKMDSDPVITTASDVTGKLAVDQIAERLNLTISNFYDAMKVSAGIVNGEAISLINDLAIDDLKLAFVHEHLTVKENQKYVVVLGNGKKSDYKASYNLEDAAYVSILNKKELILGIGCKRDVSTPHMKESVLKALESVGRTINEVRLIATVDVKKDEKALIEVAKMYDLPLHIVDREEIKKIEDQFEGSEFVKKTIGVSAVCEPVAVISAKPGKFLMKKTAFNGITISILEEEDE